MYIQLPKEWHSTHTRVWNFDSADTLLIASEHFFLPIDLAFPNLVHYWHKKEETRNNLSTERIFFVWPENHQDAIRRERKSIEACKHFLVERFDWFRPATSTQTPPPAVKDPKDISDIFLFTEKWLEIFPITLRTNYTLEELTNWLLNEKIESLWGFSSILPLCAGRFVKDFHSIGSAEKETWTLPLGAKFLLPRKVDAALVGNFKLQYRFNCWLHPIFQLVWHSFRACQYSNMLLTE